MNDFFLFVILIQIIFSRDNLDPKHDTLEDVSKEPEDWQEVNPGNVSVKVHCVSPKIYVDIFKDLKIIANRIKKYSIKVVPSSFACPPQALLCSLSSSRGSSSSESSSRSLSLVLSKVFSISVIRKVVWTIKSRDRLLHFKSFKFYISRHLHQ